MMISGKAGMGKSKELEWLIAGAANAGESIIVLDPHSILVQAIRSAAPRYFAPERMKDIVIVDLTDDENTLCINPLDVHSKAEVGTAVSTVLMLAATQLNIIDSSATKSIRLLESALIALCEANLVITDPNAKLTILHVPAFFQDRDFRDNVMTFSCTAAVYDEYRPDGPYDILDAAKQKAEYEVLLRRWSDFEKNEHLKRIFACPTNRFSAPQLMADNKIVLIDLGAQRGIPEDLALFVAGLITHDLFNKVHVYGYTYDERHRSARAVMAVFSSPMRRRASSLRKTRYSAKSLLRVGRWVSGLFSAIRRPASGVLGISIGS